MSKPRIRGVLAPVVTPFTPKLKLDAGRLLQQCRWLLASDVGLALFGTNSEANSLSADEKVEFLERAVDAGVPAARMMPGTGCCALPDSLRLTRKGVELGCGGVLMLPPFYYKGVSDEGLYRSYAEIIERVGDARLRIYLYHIPQFTHVPITLTLIERLLKDYPDTIAGVKDSSGDWSNTEAMLKHFRPEGFDVFAGSESFLLDVLRSGGAGCISATANVNPGPIARLAGSWQQNDAEEQQAGLDKIRLIFQDYVMIAALKAAIAHYVGDPAWLTLRPPLVELAPAAREDLTNRLEAAGFSMPGLSSTISA